MSGKKEAERFVCDWCQRPGTKGRTVVRPKDGRSFDLCEEYCHDIPELWCVSTVPE